MQRTWLVGALLVVATSAAAVESSSVKVVGWARGAVVNVYTQQGALRGSQNLATVNIVGSHPFNPEYNIIDIGEGRWVLRDDLKLEPCKTSSSVSTGKPGSVPRTGFASGAECQ